MYSRKGSKTRIFKLIHELYMEFGIRNWELGIGPRIINHRVHRGKNKRIYYKKLGVIQCLRWLNKKNIRKKI